jgi:hypothetical protein
MSWGWKITLLYGGFVTMMVTLVVLSSQQDIPLVRKDYYEHDLKYNEHLTRMANSQKLTKNVAVKYDESNEKITLQFPEEMEKLSGNILVFRPSQEGIDFTLPIEKLTNNTLIFGTSEMLKGKWKLKINWENNSTTYYKEVTVHL